LHFLSSVKVSDKAVDIWAIVKVQDRKLYSVTLGVLIQTAATLWQKQPMQSIWLLAIGVMPIATTSILFGLASSFEMVLHTHFLWLLLVGVAASLGMAFGFMVSTTFFAYLGYLFHWYGLLFGAACYIFAAFIGYVWVFKWLQPILEVVMTLRPAVAMRLEALHKRHIPLVLFCRVTPVLPFALTTVFLKAVRVPTMLMLSLSTIGMLPRAVAAVYLGHMAQVHRHTLSAALSTDWFMILSIALAVIGLASLAFVLRKTVRN
jgi:uncharacterized membrane protein YdjX (TVP38/TMEM64 family)